MITLNKKLIEAKEIDGVTVWPLSITAKSAIAGLDSEIFVYHAALNDDPYEGDIFECVASVQQMTELPKDAACIEGTLVVPYYRSKTMSHNAESLAAALELWEEIKEDVNDLVNNWQALVRVEDYEEL